jgi:hypothetical protein
MKEKLGSALAGIDKRLRTTGTSSLFLLHARASCAHVARSTRLPHPKNFCMLCLPKCPFTPEERLTRGLR